MISLFLSRKSKVLISFTSYVLIFCYLITIIGCETTKVTREAPGYLELFNNKRVQASQIVFKDGSFVDVSENVVFFYSKYKDTSNVLAVITYDTTRIKDNGRDALRLTQKEKLYPLANVKEIYVTKTEIDAGKTILFAFGMVAIAAIALVLYVYIDFVSTPHHSCPYIYSFDGKNYVYDAEPLGGAICEGLSRTDYSKLDYLNPSEGSFRVLVRNENEESQYLDEMKLVRVKHEINEHIVVGQDNGFYAYKEIQDPVSATDENNTDISKYLSAKDNIKWQTDLSLDGNAVPKTDRHRINLKFRKPEGVKNAMLYVNGGTALWGSGMVKEFLKLRGSGIDGWYKSVYPGSEAQKQLYAFMMNEELYYLKINLKENGKFIHRATMKGGGPKVDEDVVINIPLENVDGDFIEIELNPPPGFWKFDRIGLITDCSKCESGNINEIMYTSAIDKNCTDITERLKDCDRKYYEMPQVGNSFELIFNAPSDYDKSTYDIFLKTSGWYEIHLDKSKNPRSDLLAKFAAEPGSVLKYSAELLRMEYSKQVREYKEQMQNY